MIEETKVNVKETEIASDHLRSFIERIERLNEEKKALMEDIKEVFMEAKGNGFDIKAIKAIIKLRNTDPDQRVELETIIDLYLSALETT